MSKSLIAFALCLSFLACKTKTPDATLDTVDIPQSPVKDKKNIGFCWAYATTDFLESEYKKSSGQDINLSEEALGFYRIAEHIKSLAEESATPQDLLNEIACQRFQGLHILQRTESQRRGGFDLAAHYGVIPESAYPIKFTSEQQRNDTFIGIKERVAEVMAEKSPAELTIEDIWYRILVRPGDSNSRASAFTMPPPTRFTQGDSQLDPQTYYRQVVNHDPDFYTRIIYKNEQGFDELITLIKQALAAGYSVPFGFGVDRNHLFQEDGVTVFTGLRSHGQPNPQVVDPIREPHCPPKHMVEYAQGKHAVLITDFVNIGGREGAVDPEELRQEVAKDPQQLSYVLIKNNWGIDSEGDEGGSSWLPSATGYYRVDRAYIYNSLANGVSLNITIPRTVHKAYLQANSGNRQ